MSPLITCYHHRFALNQTTTQVIRRWNNDATFFYCRNDVVCLLGIHCI